MNWPEDDYMESSLPRLGRNTQPENGKSYIMYHGTNKEAVEDIKRYGFCQSEDGMLGRGVYVSRDIRKASHYPLSADDHKRRVLELIVNVGRVKKIDCQGHPMQKTWHDHGYDTAWVPSNCGMVPSGLEEDCVWDPSRIKVRKVIKPKFLPTSDRYQDDDSDDDIC
ncbi:hypothetical protein MATL_G00043060 [Megalops atlanticus]|uniref:PARP catalytic domain-containing protein n=1 Tax=Megalops atlanticus TaxID=7932 RepID=A0A9D3QDK0_MEGAT|nr:hypothetical protein MATL_G00043060 [Megalops atlanticus]